MIEIQAPHDYSEVQTGRVSVFLGGSIDMGKAEPWQQRFIDAFRDVDDLLFLNPRRDDFDPTMEQSADNPPFRNQVEWELHAIESSDIVVFYFDPKGLAPVTMMELGLLAGNIDAPRVIVCCPPGFWRKGNVDIVCALYGIECVESFDDLVEALADEIQDIE